LTGSGEVAEEKKRASESASQDRALLGLFWLGIPAVVAMFVYAAYEGGLAIAMLAAAASFAVGALFGFLFGIPRANTAQHVVASAESGSGSTSVDASAPMYVPNTNLEQISDWLTKILVGVGLVQIGQIGGAINTLADGLAPGLGAYGHAAAVTLLISFTVTGFLSSYLFTRLRLQGAFEPFRRALEKTEDTLTSALPLVRAQLDPAGDGGPSPEELRKALYKSAPGIRSEAFYLARNQRRDNWSGGDRHLVDLTVPVFEALITLDDDDRHFHRNFAELGYALKDGSKPTQAKYALAREKLTKAIEIRGLGGASGFSMYEFNRAYCNIKLDPALGTNDAQSTPELANAICNDLEVAAETLSGRNAIRRARDPFDRNRLLINDWLKANKDNEAVKDRVATLLKIAEGAIEI
jgi:hypothetical protein